MKYARTLTFMICMLAAIAAGGGLIIPELYKDTEFFKAAWQGNDLITLLLLPAILISGSKMYHGNPRAHVIWLGFMSYTFYNYAFYLFGAVFNKFFLLYVALFTLSLYALIIGIYSVKVETMLESFSNDKNRKVVSVVLALISLILIVVEVGQCIQFIISDKMPEVPVLIFALDLSIVVPTCLLAVVLLWRNNPWGIILGAMMLVKSFAYGLVLISGTALITIRGLRSLDPLMVFYAFVMLSGFVCSWLLLKDLKTRNNLTQAI